MRLGLLGGLIAGLLALSLRPYPHDAQPVVALAQPNATVNPVVLVARESSETARGLAASASRNAAAHLASRQTLGEWLLDSLLGEADAPVELPDTRTCSEVIADALRQGAIELHDLQGRGFTVDVVKAALATVAYDPEFYYFDLTGSTIWSNPEDSIVTQLDLAYVVPQEELAEYRARFEAGVSQALSWVDPTADDLAKCQALHDYLVRTVVYDDGVREGGSDRVEPYSAYGALVERSCVCDGYTDAYVLMLRRLGVEAQMVASAEMSHSWALVKLDGAWYHVDVTWDDPTPDRGYAETPSYTYFLRGDGEMLEVGEELHYGWQTVDQSLYGQFGEAAVRAGGSSGAYAATPECPLDYSVARWGTAQDGPWPGGVNGVYPVVYDGPVAGPAANADGSAVVSDGWYTEVDGSAGAERTYWMEGGVAARGWREIDGASYYFNPTTAVLARQRFALVDGAVRRFDEDGRTVLGQCYVDWWWYWIDPASGQLAAGTFVWTDDGRTLYCDESGHVVLGEYQTPDGVWRCFDADGGDMVRSSFIRYGADDRVCYYDADGARVYGLQWINGYEFYFDEQTGVLDEAGRALLSW